MGKCYPKWIYHKTLEAKVVNSEAEHDQAGKGWKEAPFEVDQESDATPEESKADQDQGSKDPNVKKIDLTKLTNKELCSLLIKKGTSEKELKGLNKDELIILVGNL